MLRINTLSLCASIVFFLGLVSCAKQDKAAKKDTYRAPAPRIHKGGKTIELNGWDRSSQRTLDIQDSLDVRNSGSAQVNITSRCRRGDLDFTYTLNTSENNLIAFYKTLDRNLLSEDLNHLPASCTFEIALVNGNGSRHIYSVPQSVLRDEQMANVTFERDGQKLEQKRNKFVVGQLAGVIYRFPRGSHARVLCQDGMDTPRIFSEVGRLEEHSLNPIIVKPARPAEILQTNTIQLCRILISQNGFDEGVSPLFELQLARPPLTLRPLALHNRRADMSYPETMGDPAAAALVEGRPWEAAQFIIENRVGVERTVRVQKAPLDLKIYAVMMGAMPYPVHTVTRKILFAVPSGQVTENADYYLLKVPANGSAQITFTVKPPRNLGCAPNVAVERRMALDFPSISMQEINDGGEVLAPLATDLGPRAFIASTAGDIDRVPAQPVAHICQW